MWPFWAWLTGAVLMGVLGPSPRWLGREFMHGDGGELRPYAVGLLWWAQCTFWPVALCVYARHAMYGR